MKTLKKISFLLILLLFFSCKKEGNYETSKAPNLIDVGKTIFEGKGTCTACHNPETKIIGPSMAEISKIYKEQNASIVSFLKEEGKPIVDPSQYGVMKTNFAITKTMSDYELKALEAYIMSF